MKPTKNSSKNDSSINLSTTTLPSVCTVQLYSRLTGKTLQFSSEKSTIDANGSMSSDDVNTLWKVHIVQNQRSDETFVTVVMGNYQLAIIYGEAEMVLREDLESSDKDILLKLGVVNRFIHLESSDGSGHHVGVFKNGVLKPAIATGLEIGSQFYPKLISSEVEPTASKPAKSASDTNLCAHDASQEEDKIKKDNTRTLPRNAETSFGNERMSFAQMRTSFRKLVKR